MPNYCIYGCVSQSISSLVESMRIKDLAHLKFQSNDQPHVTIMYGPSIEDGVPELTAESGEHELDSLLGGFVRRFKDKPLPSFKVVGVSYFDRPDFNILKLDLESSQMTDMQVYLRKNTTHGYDKFREDTKHVDDSYAMPPVGWCHLTLGFLKKDAPVDELVSQCNKKLLESECKLDDLEITQIQLISAVTDTPIILW